MHYWLFILILALPTYLFKIPLPMGGSFNVLDLFQIGFFFHFLYFIHQKKQWPAVQCFIRNELVNLILSAIHFLSLLFSFLHNYSATNWQAGLGLLKSYFLLPITCVFLIKYLVISQQLQLKRIFEAYFLYGLVLALVGLIYFLFGQLTFDHRLSIFFDSPNYFALAMAPAIIIGCSFFFDKKNHAQKIILIYPLPGFLLRGKTFIQDKRFFFLFIFLLLLVFCLFYTRSLGSVLGLTVAIGLLFTNYFSRHSSLVARLVWWLSVGWLIVILNLSTLLSFFHYHLQIPATSVDSRLAIYQSADRILNDHWFWGIGSANFQPMYLDYQKYFPPYPQWAVPHAHNLLLQVWLSAGIIGLLVFLLLLFLNLKPKQKNPSLHLTKIILIYFLIHGLFDTTFWKNDLSFIFWLVFLL